MSEDVNITGATFGADVPEWANEITLKKVVAQLEKSFELNAKQTEAMQKLLECCKAGGKVDTNDSKVQKKLFEEIKNQGKEQRQLNLRGGAGLNLRGSARGTMAGVGKDMFSTMTSGLGAAAAGLGSFTGELGLASTGLGKFGGFLKSVWSGPGAGFISGMGLVGSLIGQVISSVKKISGTLKNLAETGIRVEGGLVEFAGAMASTGMTMEALTALSEKYSNVMVSKGVTGIVKLTTQVGELSGGLARYGLTTADATEYVAEYLDQQRLVGVFSRRSQAEQTRAIKENVERLTAYSKILGISRKQMEESSKKMLDRDDLQRMFFTMAPEERAKALDSFKTISTAFGSLGPPGEKMLEMFTDMAAAPIPQASESFRMLAQVSPEMAMQFADMVDDMKAGKPFRVEEVVAMGKQLSGQKQLIAAFALAGGEVGQMANVLGTFGLTAEQAEQRLAEERIKAAKANNTTVEKLTDAQFRDYMSSVGEAAEGAAMVEDAMNKFRATLEYTGIKAFTDLLGGEGKDAVNAMVNGLNTITAKLREFADTTTIFKDFGEMIRNLTGTEGLSGLLATLAAATGAVGLLGAAMGGLAAFIGKLALKGAAKVLGLGGAAAGAAGKAGAKTAGKIGLGTLAGRTAARFIPGLGLVVGGGMAISDALEGDWVGAGLNAGAGLASLVPGIGTALATGLVGADIAREVMTSDAEPKDKAPPKVKQPEPPKVKTTDDLIKELISKGDGGELDVLTDIRQLMAESVRKIERVEMAIKSNGDAM
jgi:hypothetical protein